MRKIKPVLFFLIFCGILMLAVPSAWGGAGSVVPPSDEKSSPAAFSGDVTDSMKSEAAQVAAELKDQARSLFAHTPLGWDLNTLDYTYQQAVSLPGKLPDFIKEILAQSRVLGFAGSVVVLIFLVSVIYSLIGRKRVLLKAEQTAGPLFEKLPEEVYPFLMLALLSVTAALIPLILFGIFSFIKAFISYDAPWFLLTGRLLALWSIGALIISLIRGIVDQKILFIKTDYGDIIFRLVRMVVLYILFGIAVLWSAGAFGLRDDFLAFLRFLISLSIVFVLFLFVLRKKAILSLLPQLPDKSYQSFLNAFGRYYYPVIGLTLLTGLLWCIGYKRLCVVLWIKTWAVAGVYIGFSVVYYMISKRFEKWSDHVGSANEHAQAFIAALKGFILYIAIIIAALLMLDLLGLLDPVRRIMSFPLVRIGSSQLSLWIIFKAGLILVVFFYVSKLLRAYLNHKMYPSMKIEPGNAYAIDTFLNYSLLIIGVFISLEIVGFDLRALLVFAGAIGIGVGFAFQSVAANLISGFSIIFGGKIRKGDWLEVGGTLGMVSAIDLRTTKLRSRDNIEYIIPNSDIISKTIVNYSLSSPMIRLAVPFGVSYASDPKEIEKIVLTVAEKEPEVMVYKKPVIRFIGYGENSIDFQLLIWIDVRETGRRNIRSLLYFKIFDAFKQANIEIPFPQQDVHIRSGMPAGKFVLD